MRAALVSPRVTGVSLAPSWAAVERVLWLAAIDRCLRCGPSDSAATLRAYRGLRRLIDRDAPALYAATPVADAAESRWIIAAREAVDDGTPQERASVIVWAAVGAWTDAPSGRWDALADAGGALAEALDATVLDGRHPVETARVATKLRAVMAGVWATMEGGR